jgi:hypothetical protein
MSHLTGFCAVLCLHKTISKYGGRTGVELVHSVRRAMQSAGVSLGLQTSFSRLTAPQVEQLEHANAENRLGMEIAKGDPYYFDTFYCPYWRAEGILGRCLGLFRDEYILIASTHVSGWRAFMSRDTETNFRDVCEYGAEFLETPGKTTVVVVHHTAVEPPKTFRHALEDFTTTESKARFGDVLEVNLFRSLHAALDTHAAACLQGLWVTEGSGEIPSVVLAPPVRGLGVGRAAGAAVASGAAVAVSGSSEAAAGALVPVGSMAPGGPRVHVVPERLVSALEWRAGDHVLVMLMAAVSLERVESVLDLSSEFDRSRLMVFRGGRAEDVRRLFMRSDAEIRDLNPSDLLAYEARVANPMRHIMYLHRSARHEATEGALRAEEAILLAESKAEDARAAEQRREVSRTVPVVPMGVGASERSLDSRGGGGGAGSESVVGAASRRADERLRRAEGDGDEE